MSEMVVLKTVTLTDHHLRPGRTKHTLSEAAGTRDFPPFTSLTIARYPEDSGFYLLYLTDVGPGADTYHLSLADALHQAEREFGVEQDEWTNLAESSLTYTFD